MYALNDDLACRRTVYSRPLPTLPDIVVIDIPLRFRHTSLPLGRYYPILVETAEELAELEEYLARDRPAPIKPDLFDQRSSAFVADQIVFAAYQPPAHGWPHLLLCHWPPDHVAVIGDAGMFARGAYTTELFDTPDQLATASDTLLKTLGGSYRVSLKTIPAVSEVQGRA
jgi:hypothetical protein